MSGIHPRWFIDTPATEEFWHEMEKAAARALYKVEWQKRVNQRKRDLAKHAS